MKQDSLWCIALIAALGFNIYAATEPKSRKTRQAANQDSVVVFVCEHGSAKSTVAAAHFNKLARERKLKLRAISRGINPDEEVAPKAAQGLEADGLALSAAKPQKLSAADVAGAVRVVAFCDLPEAFNKGLIERWDYIPPVSDGYGRSRDAMVERIQRLLNELKPVK